MKTPDLRGNTLFFNTKNRLESNKIRQKLTALKKGYASASLIMRKILAFGKTYQAFYLLKEEKTLV